MREKLSIPVFLLNNVEISKKIYREHFFYVICEKDILHNDFLEGTIKKYRYVVSDNLICNFYGVVISEKIIFNINLPKYIYEIRICEEFLSIERRKFKWIIFKLKYFLNKTKEQLRKKKGILNLWK